MRRRKQNKKQIQIVIASVICLLLVMTVGYAAFSTNLTLTTKGNIKNTIKIDDIIKNQLVTTGDGLYFDSVNDAVNTGQKRYIYRGINPNNYILFNDEQWRIIAIEDDKTVKIVKNIALSPRSFDEITTSTSGPRLNANNTYCRLDADGNYYGCNAWAPVTGTLTNSSKSGTVTQPSTLNEYLNGDYYNDLTEESKKQMVSHKHHQGVIGADSTVSSLIMSQTQEQNSGYYWEGNIAIINIMDYLKASTNGACVGIYASRQSPFPCGDNNYLATKDYYYSLTFVAGNAANLWTASPKSLAIPGTSSKSVLPVYPTLYLNYNLLLAGTGTESDPYTIK